jgi:hypothetical protein
MSDRPYIINRREAADVHISNADFCLSKLKQMGKDVHMTRDLDLKPEHIKGCDLIISLGKTSQIITKTLTLSHLMIKPNLI